jgi:hypothetical protein
MSKGGSIVFDLTLSAIKGNLLRSMSIGSKNSISILVNVPFLKLFCHIAGHVFVLEYGKMWLSGIDIDVTRKTVNIVILLIHSGMP